jgi:hypothetical protein
MQQQAPLIGRKAMTGRAIRLQVQFVSFAVVFRLAARTGEWLGEHLGAGLLPIRHDKARVDAWLADCNLAHDAARMRPRVGLVPRRVAAGDLAPPARRGPLGLLDDLLGQCLQHRGAREACDRAQVGVRCDPLPHLGRGEGAVTAQDDAGLGPGVSQPLDEALPHRKPLCTREALGFENRRAQASREARIQMPRQEAIATILAIVAGLFLLAMDWVLRVIGIEHDALGGLS